MAELGDGSPDRADDGAEVPSEVLSPADDPLAALGGAGGFDLGSMMQMAQDMTARMGEAQEELAATEVEGSAGGGLVRLTLNGHLHLVSVSIDPAAVDPEDLSLLEDLVLAAWSDAQAQVAELQADVDPLGGLDLGGGLGGLLGGT
jgi:DNA-binding YbaB/EbfC family protein